MRIEIWSDVVCPWCYIGKRRLEKALAGFAHADEVEVVWRSFLLDPAAPAEPVDTVAEHLGQKYGGGLAAGNDMVDRIEAVAAEEGLLFRYRDALRVSTVDAHRLLHAAGDRRAELKEALLAAYFLHQQNVADHEVLVALAAGVGMDPDRAREVLEGKEYFDDVEADLRQAVGYAANGVPFFVIGGRYGVSGAQEPGVFTELLERAWAESHPALEVVGTAGTGDTAGVCGPDGCAT